MRKVYCLIANNGVALHRLITPYKQIAKFIIGDDDISDLKDSIFIFNRTMPDGWFQCLKSNKNIIICDIDDDWILPKEHPQFEEYNKNGSADKIMFNIKNSDFITVSTEYLKNKIVKQFQIDRDKIIVFPNAIASEFFNNYKNKTQLIKIGLCGSNSHLMDVSLLEGITDLPKEILNKVQFVNCGFNINEYSLKAEMILSDKYKLLSSDYRDFLTKYVKVDYVENKEHYKRIWAKDIWEYMKFYSEIDYLLIPLKNMEFNRCKSNLKLLECAATGTVPICSDVEPYSKYLNSDFCYKVSNTKGSFKKAIIKAVNNDSKREEMIKNLNIINRQFNIEEINKMRLNFLEKI